MSPLPDPPTPPARPSERTVHGVTLHDDYAWMSARGSDEVLEHLRAENVYTDAMTAHTDSLRRDLYAEMVGRIQETDVSAPIPWDDWEYYTRTVEGLQYAIRCRRRGPDGAEEVFLDENQMAEGHSYFAIGSSTVSIDHEVLAFTIDTQGGERYTLRFKDLRSGEILDESIDDVGYGLMWSNDRSCIFYCQLDEAMRQYKVFRHVLGTDARDDVCVWHEEDERFSVYLDASSSRRFGFIYSASSVTSEVRAIELDEPLSEPRLLIPRQDGIEVQIEHNADRFIIVTNDGAVNFRVVTAPLEAPTDWSELIAGRDEVRIELGAVFARYFVLSERENGLTHLRVVAADGSDDHRVEMPEPVYTVMVGPNANYDTATLRYVYTSLTTPMSHFDYDMAERDGTLVKRDPVLGGFNPDEYVTERLWAQAPDGVEVPISVVRRVDTATDGTAPGLLYGYGSYGISRDPTFSQTRLSFLDRGMVYAIAHVRGGGDLGEGWRNDGKLLKKPNTFSDFIACAQELIARGYVAADRLAIQGGSAGGMLMGAVTNMRPDLFRCVVSQVPFVDVINTMLDPTLPLTVGEYDEWGNPQDEEYFRAMLSYSPYDNIRATDYPDQLVTSGINDPRVQYWEAAKYVAKLRRYSTSERPVLLKMEMTEGHSGPSGRYDAIKETAFITAYVLDRLGVTQPAPA